MSAKYNIRMRKGESFFRELRWESEPYIYKEITAIEKSAPLRITCTAHGLLPDQAFLIQSVKGPTLLNAADPEKATDWRPATVVDVDTIEVNRVNSLDFPAYVSGGVIKYRTVKDLTGYAARMEIRDKYTGELLYALSTVLGNLVIDLVRQTVAIDIPEADAILFTWEKGDFDLELVSPDVVPVVHSLIYGEIRVDTEQTTMP